MKKIRIRDKHSGSATLVTTNTFVSGAGTGESIQAGIGASELPGQADGGAVGGLDFGSDGPTSSRSAKISYLYSKTTMPPFSFAVLTRLLSLKT